MISSEGGSDRHSYRFPLLDIILCKPLIILRCQHYSQARKSLEKVTYLCKIRRFVQLVYTSFGRHMSYIMPVWDTGIG